jgi:hypothetical protein
MKSHPISLPITVENRLFRLWNRIDPADPHDRSTIGEVRPEDFPFRHTGLLLTLYGCSFQVDTGTYRELYTVEGKRLTDTVYRTDYVWLRERQYSISTVWGALECPISLAPKADPCFTSRGHLEGLVGWARAVTNGILLECAPDRSSVMRNNSPECETLLRLVGPLQNLLTWAPGTQISSDYQLARDWPAYVEAQLKVFESGGIDLIQAFNTDPYLPLLVHAHGVIGKVGALLMDLIPRLAPFMRQELPQIADGQPYIPEGLYATPR